MQNLSALQTFRVEALYKSTTFTFYLYRSETGRDGYIVSAVKLGFIVYNDDDDDDDVII